MGTHPQRRCGSCGRPPQTPAWQTIEPIIVCPTRFCTPKSPPKRTRTETSRQQQVKVEAEVEARALAGPEPEPHHRPLPRSAASRAMPAAAKNPSGRQPTPSTPLSRSTARNRFATSTATARSTTNPIPTRFGSWERSPCRPERNHTKPFCPRSGSSSSTPNGSFDRRTWEGNSLRRWSCGWRRGTARWTPSRTRSTLSRWTEPPGTCRRTLT
mmetsp:Transcript_15965/g.44160  ORF Transcript_15965/g.44160 Transcript_15965/m.44160 type:complete len:213 (-) Transcript_15965:525-1163(-)